MTDLQRISLDEIVAHFQGLEDPRSTVNRRHPLVSVVVIALLAVLAGAGGPTAIARWAALKEDLLSRVLDLPNGAPRTDVFRRVLRVLKPAAFQACFASWLQSLRVEAAAETGVDRPVLPVDGQDLAAESRSPEGTGGAASGQRVGRRVRSVTRADGLRREVERDHGHPRTPETGGHRRGDRHHRRDGHPEGDRRAGRR